jgi:DNA-binding CsgD family transcriptional regulator
MAVNLEESVAGSLRGAAMAADIGSAEDDGARQCSPLGAVWEELATGSALIVDSFCCPERCFLVTKARGSDAVPPVLSPRNLEILRHALLAPMQKTAAHELGITQSAVAFAAARCLRGMGLDCTASTAPTLIVAAAQAYQRDGQPPARNTLFEHGGCVYRVCSMRRPEPASGNLSVAERDIVRHIVERRSNQEIARLRATSQRTVANQLSRVLAKLGVDGRLGVVQRLLQGPDRPERGVKSALRASLAAG